MKKSSRKLALHRDTLRTLGSSALQQANGGATNFCSIFVPTCASCVTHCNCPTLQNCTATC